MQRLQQVPPFDVLITNPPYSDDHINRLFEFVTQCNKPYFLLMPNFVYTKVSLPLSSPFCSWISLTSASLRTTTEQSLKQSLLSSSLHQSVSSTRLQRLFHPPSHHNQRLASLSTRDEDNPRAPNSPPLFHPSGCLSLLSPSR
jgi:hypothetical protein